ncbi:MAG: ABC transporter ATP-binding protein [Planctomycetes bacterium]|nr:ABC transporter ATP-binding protein [Planctomycetota bacterium]
MADNNDILLKVRNLRTYFDTDDGIVKAVDGVSFDIRRGETFALVGESGCGKSVTAFSIMRLLQMPPALITSQKYMDHIADCMVDLKEDRQEEHLYIFRDCLCRTPETQADGGPFSVKAPSSIEFEGGQLLDLPEDRMRKVRGGRIGMIFQEPMSSLNPVFTCGDQIVEAIKLHRPDAGWDAKDMAVSMLAKVGIPDPAMRYDEYPHQLSGGMRQRVMIAMALSCDPTLLIADEPTTALDVTIQAQILDLMRQLQVDSKLSTLLITHDLAVVAETAHRVAVMYASKIAETADVNDLFASPLHPYTRGLFRSLPRLGEKKHRLDAISGNVPNPLNFPAGCKFHPRCPIGRDLVRCRTQEPRLRLIQPDHACACWECPGYESAPPVDQAAQEPVKA